MQDPKIKIIGIKGIIFDFDLTLADSSRGVVKCVNYALKELGLEELSEKDIIRTIGLTLDHTFNILVGEQYIDKREEFSYLFVKKADKIMADNTILFKETSHVIRGLYNKGFKLGIVSTKFRYRIETILSRENLLKYFKVIIGGEDLPILKPDPAGLLLAVEELNLNSSNVVYIGDSKVDAETANRANISFIAVLSGVTPRNAFSQYKVIYILDNLSELPNLLYL